ncbi:unnamed protein product [Wuchereria bancrofti]|uniref:Uncharacterized protein n=1 Tax=Wuchereria bancrofti TaxID=6293 RepID=A0A3P7FQ27_WUCBA|nr:unnamed protein product [Wuchereria bancrofti]
MKSHLSAEECFSNSHEVHYARTFPAEEIDRMYPLCAKETSSDELNTKSSQNENEGKTLTEIAEMVTTSRPPEMKTVEFDGNPKL